MRGFIRGLVWIAAIFGAMGVLLHLFVFDHWEIPRDDAGVFASSIFPTLLPYDKVLLRREKTPAYGQLARCISPVTGEFVVGRVFGLAGDRVEVNDAQIRTNGKAVGIRHRCDQKKLAHPLTGNLLTLECGVSDLPGSAFEFVYAAGMATGQHYGQVEAGKLYLVSDNRLLRQDSRDYGQVEAATCEAIVFRLWGEKYSDASRRFTVL